MDAVNDDRPLPILPTNDSSPTSVIGPFASAVGLYKQHFTGPDDAVIPGQQTIPNGLVLELHSYLTTTLKYAEVEVVKTLIKIVIGDHDEIKISTIEVALNRLIKEVKKCKRDKKGKKRDEVLDILKQKEFKLVRKRALKLPDTPRKKQLRQELQNEKEKHKRSRKQLAVAEDTMVQMQNCLHQNEVVLNKLNDEQNKNEAVIEEFKTLKEESIASKEQLDNLRKQYQETMDQLSEINQKFNPIKDDLEMYKTKYEEKELELSKLTKAYCNVATKLAHTSTRNVNKRIKTREIKIKAVEKQKDDALRKNDEMSKLSSTLSEELKDCRSKLAQTEKEKKKLKERLEVKSKNKANVHKRHWKLKQAELKGSDNCDCLYTKQDIDALEDRIDMLSQKNKELNDLVALLDQDVVKTFENGKYVDDVRETVMGLLSLNVSMAKVSEVIKIVLTKLANKGVDRLPSSGTISQIRLEARHIADLEVGLAMRKNQPEEALGNCIHGDGTTKYHKKYQNFQVTLPDGTSRTLSLQRVAAGDTDAVVNAYKDRMKELAVAVAGVEGANVTDINEQLLTTVKSAMTDQGPSMPQFGDRLQSIREDLLPKVVKNWENLSAETQEEMAKFGQFYCKMHPLINFAEECNKVLKSLEDISTSGKNVHTILTSEAGVTRLVRTASKAFHHRGCDKSGVEEAFSTYLDHEYNTKNYLVQYIGNRANILFEGAAATYYHLTHITNFVAHLPEPNCLLKAVSEDAQEKIHLSELRALGIVHKIITEPLWHVTKCAENILSLNKPLHDLQLNLIKWKDDASALMKGDCAMNEHIVKDEIYDCLFAECTDPEVHAMCQQALELICCSILLILERQCKDQLPGGRYWAPSNEMEVAYANVPSTNMIGERDFAWLDFLVREKPSARVITLETLIMWANNGTRQWLDNLDSSTKAIYMEQARAHAPNILEHYKNKITQIKKQRWEQLQQKQKEKAEKEANQVISRLQLSNEIAKQGGIWHTSNLAKQKFDEYDKSMSDEAVRRALYIQLTFHKKILLSKAPKKEYFQMSTTKDGQSKKFSKFEMLENLLQIILANDFPSDYTNATEKQLSPKVSYTGQEEQQEKYYEVKQKLFGKIINERNKRAVKQSQLYMDRLINQPQLLVNKRVQHQCKDPNGVDRWFNGIVIGMTPHLNDDHTAIVSKTMYTIKYEESQLSEDEPSEEVFPLLVDLKRHDLIIVDKI